MTQQLDVLSKEPLYMGPDNMPAGSIGAMQPSEGDMLPARSQDQRLMPLVADPDQRRLESFDIDRIQVGHRTRALNTERLEALVQSISTIGLRSPITVRIVPKMMVDGVAEEDVPVLVAGLHRLEAIKELGRKSIDCFVEPGSELDAQLWEIDENLCRAELSELERAEHLQSRQTIYEQIYPESRQGGLPGASGGGKAKTANLAGFATDTGKHTGIAERTIRRAVRRANDIDPTVRDRIRDKPEIADNGIELDTLASMPAAEQKTVIDIIEAGQATSVREAKKRLGGPAQAEKTVRDAVAPAATPPGAQNSSLQPLEESDFSWEARARLLIPLLVNAVLRLDKLPDEERIKHLLVHCHFRDLAEQLSKRSNGSIAVSLIENAAESFRIIDPLEPNGTASEGPRLEAVAEAAPSTPPETAVEMPKDVCIGEVAPGTSPTPVAETPTDDCIGSTAEMEPLLPSEVAGETVTDDYVEVTIDTALLEVGPEPSSDLSAEVLMTMWSLLKPTTQWYGQQEIADGTKHPEEHHKITEALVPFRAAASRASPAERQRFLDMIAPQMAGRVEGVA